MGSSHRAYRVHDKAGNRRGAGGANRDRTGDLLVANQTLSQLSYGPVNNRGAGLRSCGVGLRTFPRYVGGSGRSCTPDLTLIRGAL
jgi:hypothetical protein